ncbi:MAG: MerR family DNA-binding protein [Candidatus Dormibacteraceae bacterium]
METLAIGDVARRAGLQPSALRYYEDIELLPAPARVNGRRRYAATVLDRLAVIRMAQAADFTLAETRTLLHGFAPGTPPPERWRKLAVRKLREVEAQIARLDATRRILEEGLHCQCLVLEECARTFGATREAGDEKDERTG